MTDTVKLIIEIPEEDYNKICKLSTADLLHMPIFNGMALYGIKTGTLLPKEHGRLIDADGLDVISYQHTSDDFDNGVMWLAEQIDNAPTIIEADKEDE